MVLWFAASSESAGYCGALHFRTAYYARSFGSMGFDSDVVIAAICVV
jgi:hypothetical protein